MHQNSILADIYGTCLYFFVFFCYSWFSECSNNLPFLTISSEEKSFALTGHFNCRKVKCTKSIVVSGWLRIACGPSCVVHTFNIFYGFSISFYLHLSFILILHKAKITINKIEWNIVFVFVWSVIKKNSFA